MQNLGVPGFADVRGEARGICAELGDSACVMAAYRIEANAMAVGGDSRRRGAWIGAGNRAAHGERARTAEWQFRHGRCGQTQGDLPVAETYWRAALAVGGEMGPQKSYPVGLDLAEVSAQKGQNAEARKLIERSLEVAREIGDREGVAMGEAALADLLAMSGQRSEALA